MPVTINGDGSISGLAVGGISDTKAIASSAVQSGAVIQSVTKMGTACYNMTNTSWGTELSTDFRITLSSVQASNSKILILFSSKMRHASHTNNILKQYRPAFSTNGGSSFTNLNAHSAYIGSSNWGDDHIAYSATNAINMGGEAASFSDGVIFTPLARTSNSSYGFQLGGCALGATTTFTVMEIKI